MTPNKMLDTIYDDLISETRAISHHYRNKGQNTG